MLGYFNTFKCYSVSFWVQMGHQGLLAPLGCHVETRLDVSLIGHRKQNENQWIKASQKYILTN